LDLYIHHLLPDTIAEPLSSIPEFLSPGDPESIISRVVDALSIEQWQLLAAIKMQFGPFDRVDPTWSIEDLDIVLEDRRQISQIITRFQAIAITRVDNKYVDQVLNNPAEGLRGLLVSYPLCSLSCLPLHRKQILISVSY
jgi:hypothetical protein